MFAKSLHVVPTISLLFSSSFTGDADCQTKSIVVLVCGLWGKNLIIRAQNIDYSVSERLLFLIPVKLQRTAKFISKCKIIPHFMLHSIAHIETNGPLMTPRGGVKNCRFASSNSEFVWILSMHMQFLNYIRCNVDQLY